MPPPARPRPFHLLRSFVLLGGLVIGALGVANALLISHFLNEQLFQHEATVTRDMVQHVLTYDGVVGYFSTPHDPALARRFDASIGRLSRPRSVLRTNVFSADGQMLRSGNSDLVGQRFLGNAELARALQGELAVHAGPVDRASGAPRAEQAGLNALAQYFVEIYLPVRDASGRVVGVLEIYKEPVALTHAIETGRRWAAASALLGALALFASLTGLVFRADRALRQQQQRLREADALSAVGQLAATVAHNIRNPLASIRSSAELAQDAPPAQARECASDILQDADRISARINELLRLVAPTTSSAERVDLVRLLNACAQEQQALFARRQQRLLVDLPVQPMLARADAQQLRHVLHSLLSNAAEALPPRGRCRLQLKPGKGQRLRIEVQDNGCGMAPEALAALFQPFVTNKPQGLGLGLLLARRTVERLGGQLTLKSKLAVGTTVRIELPAA